MSPSLLSSVPCPLATAPDHTSYLFPPETPWIYEYICEKGSVELERVTIKRVEQRRRLRLFCKLTLPANFYIIFVFFSFDFSDLLCLLIWLTNNFCPYFSSSLTQRFLNERSFGLG